MCSVKRMRVVTMGHPSVRSQFACRASSLLTLVADHGRHADGLGAPWPDRGSQGGWRRGKGGVFGNLPLAFVRFTFIRAIRHRPRHPFLANIIDRSRTSAMVTTWCTLGCAWPRAFPWTLRVPALKVCGDQLDRLGLGMAWMDARFVSAKALVSQ